jgi:hypothetical protein
MNLVGSQPSHPSGKATITAQQTKPKTMKQKDREVHVKAFLHASAPSIA